VQEVAARLGCPPEHVALGVLASGLGRFLHQRGDKLESPTLRTLVWLAPEAAAASPLRVALPVSEPDVLRTVVDVAYACSAASTAEQAGSFELLDRVESWIPAWLQVAAGRSGLRTGAQLAVQWSEGPREPFSVLGAPCLEAAVLRPLLFDQGLSVAITASGPWLEFGFNSDWDLLPDLHELVGSVAGCFARLAAAPDASGKERSR
jgi:hypothetical protein